MKLSVDASYLLVHSTIVFLVEWFAVWQQEAAIL